MVDVGVKVVNTDGINTKNLHKSSISHTGFRMAQRVLSSGRVVTGTASRLVGHTNNLEFVASIGVDEVGSLDLQRRNGIDDRGPKGQESRLDLNRMSVSMWCNVKQCDLYSKIGRLWRDGESTYKHGDNVLLSLVCDNFSKNHDKCIIWSVNVSESQSE